MVIGYEPGIRKRSGTDLKQDNNEIVYGGEPVNPDRIYRFGRLDALGRQDEQDEQVLAAPGPQTFSEPRTANSKQRTGGYPVQVDRMNRRTP